MHSSRSSYHRGRRGRRGRDAIQKDVCEGIGWVSGSDEDVNTREVQTQLVQKEVTGGGGGGSGGGWSSGDDQMDDDGYAKWRRSSTTAQLNRHRRKQDVDRGRMPVGEPKLAKNQEQEAQKLQQHSKQGKNKESKAAVVVKRMSGREEQSIKSMSVADTKKNLGEARKMHKASEVEGSCSSGDPFPDLSKLMLPLNGLSWADVEDDEHEQEEADGCVDDGDRKNRSCSNRSRRRNRGRNRGNRLLRKALDGAISSKTTSTRTPRS